MVKTACIFGSTGLTGTYLIEVLLEDKRYNKILVFNRTKQNLFHPKIEQIVAPYDQLQNLKDQLKADEYYCCLGTTMNKAKTRQAFEYVDYHLPLEIGKLARENGIKTFSLVSSIGASAKSKNFYLRTKGKTEDALSGLGLDSLLIFRPSMLLGKRKETRLMETIAKPFTIALGIILWGPLKKYRAIHGKTIAKGMVYASNQMAGNQLIESDRIKTLAEKYDSSLS
jgi:uncharacterized protein YbjT (DUF2867 family)